MACRLTPSRRAFWKRHHPTSLRAALEGCKEHAREARNLSVERIAAEMGLNDHWSLYKWIESGRFPAVLLPTYQAVCGINLVTRWLANDNIKALVNHAFQTDKAGKINTGRVLGLRQLNITDEKWQKAMQAISDSIRVASSKPYVRFYKRDDESGDYAHISLDAAAV